LPVSGCMATVGGTASDVVVAPAASVEVVVAPTAVEVVGAAATDVVVVAVATDVVVVAPATDVVVVAPATDVVVVTPATVVVVAPGTAEVVVGPAAVVGGALVVTTVVVVAPGPVAVPVSAPRRSTAVVTPVPKRTRISTNSKLRGPRRTNKPRRSAYGMPGPVSRTLSRQAGRPQERARGGGHGEEQA